MRKSQRVLENANVSDVDEHLDERSWEQACVLVCSQQLGQRRLVLACEALDYAHITHIEKDRVAAGTRATMTARGGRADVVIPRDTRGVACTGEARRVAQRLHLSTGTYAAVPRTISRVTSTSMTGRGDGFVRLNADPA